MTSKALESERAQAQKRALNRLKRARGQLDTVIRTVEKGRRYSDIVTQLAAVNSALQRAGFSVISSTMRDCVNNKKQTPEDIETQFKELEEFFFSLS